MDRSFWEIVGKKIDQYSIKNNEHISEQKFGKDFLYIWKKREGNQRETSNNFLLKKKKKKDEYFFHFLNKVLGRFVEGELIESIQLKISRYKFEL